MFFVYCDCLWKRTVDISFFVDCGILVTLCGRRRCLLVDVHNSGGSCTYILLFKHFDWCTGENLFRGSWKYLIAIIQCGSEEIFLTNVLWGFSSQATDLEKHQGTRNEGWSTANVILSLHAIIFHVSRRIKEFCDSWLSVIFHKWMNS